MRLPKRSGSPSICKGWFPDGDRETLPPAVDQAAADLVAAKDGLITSLIVVEGTPLVEEGATVSRGELLIRGEKTLWYLDGSSETKKIKAEGRVLARVWYEQEIEEPLVHYEPVSAPGQRVVYSLRIKTGYFLFAGAG